MYRTYVTSAKQRRVMYNAYIDIPMSSAVIVLHHLQGNLCVPLQAQLPRKAVREGEGEAAKAEEQIQNPRKQIRCREQQLRQKVKMTKQMMTLTGNQHPSIA